MPQLRRTWGGRQRSDARGAHHPPPTYLSRTTVHIMLLFIKPHFNAFSIWLPIATYGNAPFRVGAVDAVHRRGNAGGGGGGG